MATMTSGFPVNVFAAIFARPSLAYKKNIFERPTADGLLFLRKALVFCYSFPSASLPGDPSRQIRNLVDSRADNLKRGGTISSLASLRFR